MILSHFPTSPSAKTRFGASLTALPFVTVLAAAVLPVQLSMPVHATDLDYTQSVGGQQEDGNFLRIGIGKSAVIKLPAAAKDVIVGDPTVVDVVLRNRNTAYLFARSPAQTNVFFFDADGNQILNLEGHQEAH
jgi:pilus assembly protein CpaC